MKELYRKGEFDVKLRTRHKDLGEYQVITFHGLQGHFLRKTINPQDYDQYTNINEFVKHLQEKDEIICDFFFVEKNKQNRDNFDLIFEYGKQLPKKLQSNRQIWALINGVLQTLRRLEDKKMHYPCLKRHFIVETQPSIYKLMNPYSFQNYLKEVLQIYMNPMRSLSQKEEYFTQKLAMSVKQLGSMICCFLGSFDGNKLCVDRMYRNNCL